jgi:UDP-2-acetamido-2,6-beta-L-arabino-hexul-4-ose reductase
MIKVGITGQTGFIGTHLYNYLNLKKDEVITVPFEDRYFENDNQLRKFVNECDAVVHLAALNRHGDPQVIYDTNIRLVKQLIKALEGPERQIHVLFSSSTQEEMDNLYGKSKHDGRLLFEQWAVQSNNRFTGFVIPNVFGPFGNPFYNSVVATFCHQLTHNGHPKIVIDANLQLIYINELVDQFYQKIISRPESSGPFRFNVRHTSENNVSEILLLLEKYKKLYFEEHCFPELNSAFELNLFNTFRSYIDHSSHYPVLLKKNADQRGAFIETIKTSLSGQFSFSTTNPDVTRGNHYHTRKIERFIVIKGRAVIELRRIGTNKILHFELNGEQPSFVDMPVWYTHNITNIGDDELITLFWINEFFNPSDPDTYFDKV